jgi:hypothetical protein
MNLPPELLDEIIGHLPINNQQKLRDCSLVAKSWIYPSQKRLFKSVEIEPRNLSSWQDSISRTNVVLLGHVRILRYEASELAHCALRHYFPSFRQLRHLTLVSTRLSSLPQQIELFSAFQHTLSAICLRNCSIPGNAFVTLINHFPHLVRLGLRSLDFCKEDGPILPLSRLLLKRLYVSALSTESLDFLGELSKQGLRFEEGCRTNTPDGFLQACR